MIRNVVFDMGNVIIVFDPEQFMDREDINVPEDRRIIRNEVFRSLEWADMDRGLLREETAAPTILSRVPEHLKEKARNLIFNWAYPRTTVPGMEILIQRLKKAGYGIYLLSNASKAQPVYWSRMPVSEFFDGTLISCDVLTVKPDLGIYRMFTDKFGLIGEECVFIDDAPINVEAAVVSGWKGIVFNGSAKETEEKLKSMGLMF